MAAIRDMVEDADEIIGTVRDSVRLVMQPENVAALALHKAKQAHSITESEYAERIRECSSRMTELEAQQAEMQTAASRYAEVKAWLDAFQEHIESGDIMNIDDDAIIKQLVEQVIVNDDGIEIQFKCGAAITKEYEAA